MQENSSLQYSDLDVHLAVEGLSPGQQHLGAEQGRAALPPTQLDQEASNRPAQEMESTSACKWRSGDKECLGTQTSR